MRRSTTVTLIVAVTLALLLVGGLSYLLLSGSSSNSPHLTPPGAATCPSSLGNSTAGNWTTYHQDSARAGVEPSPPVGAVRPAWSQPSGVDGQVYAEPLVCGDSVYVATENDSVYALNATSGTELWRTHLGTPVPLSSLPCGDIDPSGITGTPVIDVASGTLYVVAFLMPAEHVLFGLDTANGSVRSQVVVDPANATPTVEQQRGALALANGVVYIPYGGLWGDCGPYHGWVVGVRTDGTPGLLSYQVPTNREGGIWSPAGITVAPDGNLYVATGNGDSTTTFDYGNSVIELSPSLSVLGYFAPTNWATLNSGDTDLGSVAPTLLPNGAVFEVGKQGVGYVLSATHLGGIGGDLFNASICGGGYGGTAHVGQLVLVPCADGLVALTVGVSNFSVDWSASGFDAGSPIVTGNVVWAVNVSTSELLGFNLTDGAVLFAFPLGSVDHFASPAAAPGRLFVGAGSQVYAFAES